MMAELKPCPFCGANLVKKMHFWLHPVNNCFLASADSEYGNVMVTQGEIPMWNRRYEPVSEIDYDYEAEDD